MAEEDVSVEITVYGDVEPSEPESQTDTISIPVDFLTFYGPVGPTILTPTGLPPGPSGDDTSNKSGIDQAGHAATVTSLGWTIGAVVFGLIPGFGQVVAVYSVFAVGFALLGEVLGHMAEDPPQPDYKRAAGSTIPLRKLTLPGAPDAVQSLEPLLAAERGTAVFVDAMECFQGAFLAADAPWTQRHTQAAATAYSELGRALDGTANSLQSQAEKLRVPRVPPDVANRLPEVIAAARPVLGLSAADEAHVTERLRLALSRGAPTQADIRSAVETFQRLGRRLASPRMVRTRFAFVKSRPLPRR